ncbi:MAG: hypothetical protein DMF25_03505 [Verrucomicrobia bacterium]|nr:MAG: hypothetical protein DMF25_03505 [Verrucomicrobiota bacterium]
MKTHSVSKNSDKLNDRKAIIYLVSTASGPRHIDADARVAGSNPASPSNIVAALGACAERS